MARDDEAFRAFALAAAPGLLRFATVLSGDPHTGEDLVQRAFEKVFVRFAKLSDPLAYARQVVVNASRDGWRVQVRRPERLGLDSVAHPSYEDPAQALADREQLLQLVGSLPHRQRAAVLLRHWLDLSEHQTADLLGVSVGTVKSLTSRGLSTLQERLDTETSTTPGRTS